MSVDQDSLSSRMAVPHRGTTEFRRFERRATLKVNPGMEGMYVASNCFKGNSIAVFTSGGDAQGMNSAVRAVVRMGIYVGCSVYFIKEGYQGMVDGGNNIVEAGWADVSGIMNKGGTTIGSARCQDFRERPGRLKACKNLILHGITNLVVIGGDGSLTGANLFRLDWPDLLKELVDTGEVTEEAAGKHPRLNIVGLVGSIDNDFCGTDMTIGTDSALHRIVECCDAIVTTAHSHQRCFVLEVMGRHCGYLGLVSALATEADWVFIPELPPSQGWEEDLCSKLTRKRQLGQRVTIIIVSEGAIDCDCNPITAEQIRMLITDRLKFDTRITVLGHVQRGGHPSAFDRVLGIRMGAEAVLAVMEASRDASIQASVISINGNQTVRAPMLTCVEDTRAVADAMKLKDFNNAVKLRGRSFINNLEMYLTLSKITPPQTTGRGVLGLINVGAPACGMNAAMRSFVRLTMAQGFTIMGINGGFQGLIEGTYDEIKWNDVRGWARIGGSFLGTRRKTPGNVGLEKCARRIEELKLSGLLIIGGFEAFVSLGELFEGRNEYNSLCIPMCVIPATISNNIPGSDFSLGADTALNEITAMIDKTKQSALGTKRRVFVVETMGANCGYLATLSGLAGGADAAYIFEEQFSINDLREDVVHLRAKIEDGVQRGLVVVSDSANVNYSTEFIARLYSEEGKGVFDTRWNRLGHSQQGGVPSPFDRNMATKMGAKVAEWMGIQIESYSTDGVVHTTDPETACVLGLKQRSSVYTPVIDLMEEADFKNRIPKNEWWLSLRPLMRIMAKHDSLYESQSIMAGVEQE